MTLAFGSAAEKSDWQASGGQQTCLTYNNLLRFVIKRANNYIHSINIKTAEEHLQKLSELSGEDFIWVFSAFTPPRTA